MTRKCPMDSTEVFDDAASMCGEHLCPLETVADTAPAAQPGRADDPARGTRPPRKAWSTAECWHCHRTSPNAANVECLNPECRRSLIPPAMHIEFSGGEVEVRPGGQVDLGRQGPHGRVFRAFPNISRRHAVVGVDDDGRAWITPLATPNGTFVNGTEIPDSINRTLASGDKVRFARNAEGAVTLYDR